MFMNVKVCLDYVGFHVCLSSTVCVRAHLSCWFSCALLPNIAISPQPTKTLVAGERVQWVKPLSCRYCPEFRPPERTEAPGHLISSIPKARQEGTGGFIDLAHIAATKRPISYCVEGEKSDLTFM